MRERVELSLELNSRHVSVALHRANNKLRTVKNQYLSHHQPDIYDMKMVVVVAERTSVLHQSPFARHVEIRFYDIKLAVSRNAQQ